MRDNIKAMKIRNIDLGEKPVLLAPMEDVTDPAFRLMCKQFGADMVYTEFVSSDALIRSVGKTMLKLNISEKERPVAIQIYGKDTDTMVEAARIVEQAKPDILDLNFGCPVPKVTRRGGGSALPWKTEHFHLSYYSAWSPYASRRASPSPRRSASASTITMRPSSKPDTSRRRRAARP